MAIPMPLDYLRESLVGAEEAVRLKTRGLVEIPTGGGKTRLAAKILATLNIPSVFIVHRDTIFRQSVAEFKKMGVPIGIIKGAKKNIETINVATIQTLHSVMKNSYESPIRSFVLNECQAIIVDEAHHAGSPMYKYVLQRFVNAYYRVGLSATPHRHEEKANPSTDMQVQGTFGRIIYSVPKQELQDKKALVPARVFYI